MEEHIKAWHAAWRGDARAFKKHMKLVPNKEETLARCICYGSGKRRGPTQAVVEPYLIAHPRLLSMVHVFALSSSARNAPARCDRPKQLGVPTHRAHSKSELEVPRTCRQIRERIVPRQSMAFSSFGRVCCSSRAIEHCKADHGLIQCTANGGG